MQPLKDKAIQLLARREHTRRELQQKLQQRGYALSEITSVLDNLEQEELLSEERYIGSYIRLRRARGYGPLKICVELQKRGINHRQILANEEWLQTQWQEWADAVRAKRFGEASPSNGDERASQMRYLQQRGFTTDQIHIALKARTD